MLSIPTCVNSVMVGYCLFGLSSLVLAFVALVPHNRRLRLLAFSAWTIMSLLTLSYSIIWELTGSGFNESIPYHIRFGVEGAGLSDFSYLKVTAGVVLLLLLVSFYCFRRFIVKDHHTRHYYYTSLVPFAVLGALHPLWREMHDTFKEREISPVPFEEHYTPPTL